MNTKSQVTKNKLAARKWALKFVVVKRIVFKGKKNKILLSEINKHQNTNYISLVDMYFALKQSFSSSEIEIINKSKVEKKKRHQEYKHGDDFYKSKQWRDVRFKALKLSDGKCVLCGRSKAKHGVVLHVDHIKPRSLHPKLELAVDNLQILCEDCNLGKSNRDDTDFRKPVTTRHSVNKGMKNSDEKDCRKTHRKDYYSSTAKKFTRKEVEEYENKMWSALS